MKIDEAVSILRAHNEWRRAPAHLPEDAMPAMGDPRKIGIAIDTVCDALEALRAEVERLRTDLMESDEIREKLGHLLTRTAAALKGEPPAGVWHSWHDLPEKATQLAEALKKVAQSLEWYAHGRCRGFDDEAPLPTDEAVELAERTLAKELGDGAREGGAS